jgi:hypothetical protein
MAVLPALAALAAVDTPAQAAWNNVFQVSCFHHRRRAVAAYAPCCPAPAPVVAAAAPCCPDPCPPPPCPQPVCTTRYIQRCYYQPVTTYQQRNYLEPVTTYRTSYYYEPVCSYRYSCYYDPCTCSYQQVATPVTSYRLRSQCNAVTSYLQRCQMVPVTSYQLRTYYEPVTTCCTPPVTPCCTPAAPAAVPAVPAVGAVPSVPTVPSAPSGAVPGVGEQQQQVVPSQKPRVGEEPMPPAGTRLRRFQETQPPPTAGAPDNSFRQPQLRSPVPALPAAPPRVRLDRIAALPDHNVEGQVVIGQARTPQAGARLLFVSASSDGRQQSVTADGRGRFQATLPTGSWLVYVRDGDGAPVFQSRLTVSEQATRQVTLAVSR